MPLLFLDYSTIVDGELQDAASDDNNFVVGLRLYLNF